MFAEARVQSEDAAESSRLLDEYQQEYVEEELSESFSRLITFVRQTEQALERDGESKESIAQISKPVLETQVRQFAQTWKAGISHVAKSINTYFTDSKLGMALLKRVLTQLLLYHSRFQAIVQKVFNNQAPPFKNEMVPLQTLLFEIRKYSRGV